MVLYAAVITIVSAFLLSATAEAQEKSGIKAAVVDINTIAEKYEKHKDKMERLKNEVRGLEDELKKLEETMKGLQERRTLFEDDPEKYDEYTQQIEEIKIKGVIKRNTELKRLNRKQKQLVKTLYDEIRKGVAEYARKHGYDLVMVELGEVGDELIQGDIKDILNKINIRSVIYASDDLDITDKVIDYMNTQYRKELSDKIREIDGEKAGKKKDEKTTP